MSFSPELSPAAALAEPTEGTAPSMLGGLVLQQNLETSPRDLILQTFSDLRESVHPPFIADIVLPTMFKLAEQINDNLASYDLIVGEDTSGRLPALLYWHLANTRRREAGLAPASLRFMNGRYDVDIWDNLDNPLPKGTFPEESADSSRALVVSEFIYLGKSARRVYAAVGRQRDKSRVDIAALGSALRDVFMPLDDGSNLYIVDRVKKNEKIDTYLSGLLGGLRGVQKSYGHNDKEQMYTRRSTRFRPEKVRQAREDIHLIADAFYPLLPPPANLEV